MKTVIKNIYKRIFSPRRYWELRAKALLYTGGWIVGRTDMYSFLGGNYVHYAYPPDKIGVRFGFLGSPTGALRKAVLYAEKMNKEKRKHKDSGCRALP